MRTRLFFSQVSYLEIYNEQLRDLLCPSTPAARIQVMEDKRTGATVKGLKEEDVYSPAEVSEDSLAGIRKRARLGETITTNTTPAIDVCPPSPTQPPPH